MGTIRKILGLNGHYPEIQVIPAIFQESVRIKSFGEAQVNSSLLYGSSLVSKLDNAKEKHLTNRYEKYFPCVDYVPISTVLCL